MLVGTWEIPGGDLSLCYRFDPDHRVQIGGYGETEAIAARAMVCRRPQHLLELSSGRRGVSAPQAS